MTSEVLGQHHGVCSEQPGEGGCGEEQEDRQGAGHGRGEGQQGGEAAAAGGRRVRQEHHSQADEDHPRDGVQSGGVLAVPGPAPNACTDALASHTPRF